MKISLTKVPEDTVILNPGAEYFITAFQKHYFIHEDDLKKIFYLLKFGRDLAQSGNYINTANSFQEAIAIICGEEKQCEHEWDPQINHMGGGIGTEIWQVKCLKCGVPKPTGERG